MFIWIWQIDNLVNKYGNIDKLISKLKSLNINDVCIKFHEGAGYIGGGVNFRDDFIKYKENFKNAGFKVGTWGYNYFNYIDTEAKIVIEALDNSDYYIFDTEVDVSNKFAAAEIVCKTVRNAHPNAVLGYSSFPIVSLHLDIPYTTFNKYCNFASPQSYWGEMQWDINKCIDKMLLDHKDYGLNLPIYPSIQTYNVSADSYVAYTKYAFNQTGAWSLDDIDSTFESFIGLYRDGVPVVNQNRTWLQVGDKGIAVKNLQINLIKLGFSCGSSGADGIYGNTTKNAVYKFQQNLNIQADGLAGIQTQEVINKILAKSICKKGINSDAVRYIQYRVGSVVDGIFGINTDSAVRKWQKKNKLVEDGIVGPATWGKLIP